MVDSLLGYAVLAIGSLFAVVNPFATVPLFVAMTATNTVAERKTMAKRSSLIAFVVVTIFALTGLRVLSIFQVSVPAFQIAGGLVLVSVAFDLLQGEARLKVTPAEAAEGTRKVDISVTPLGIPVLCGPATITTAILISSHASEWGDMLVLILVIAGLYGVVFVLLRFAAVYSNRLGETTIGVSSRLMGLILVAVGVQFILEGVRQANLF